MAIGRNASLAYVCPALALSLPIAEMAASAQPMAYAFVHVKAMLIVPRLCDVHPRRPNVRRVVGVLFDDFDRV